MTLIPLAIPQGIYANGTKYQSKGRWSDGNLVRFSEQTIRPVGGWVEFLELVGGGPATQQMVLGDLPRGAVGYEAVGGQAYYVFGTLSTLEVNTAGTSYDITPILTANELYPLLPGNKDTTQADSTSGLYGAALYGLGLYGVASTVLGVVTEADMWHLDTFGDWTVGCMLPTNQRIYVWEKDTGERAKSITTGNGYTEDAPQPSRGVVVTPERFLVCLGADGDVRKVAWAARETVDVWTPLITNTAGAFILPGTGRIMRGVRGRGETLLFTDSDVFAMRYIGGTFVYSFEKRGGNCGLIAPQAVARIDMGFAWMSSRGFYLYDGYARPLPSSVSDYVFSDFNHEQKIKITAFNNHQFGEVWWFYCSAAETEPDRYVLWNYRENTWSVGDLTRMAPIEASASTKAPVLCDELGNVWQHETAWFWGGVTPYLESGPVELGNGDQVMHATDLIPDERTQGDVEATFFAAFYPNQAETTHGPYSLANPTSIRLAGRQVRVRLDAVRAIDWRVGVIRFNAEVGGLR